MDLVAIAELAAEDLGCWPGQGIHSACTPESCHLREALLDAARGSVAETQRLREHSVSAVLSRSAVVIAERRVTEMSRALTAALAEVSAHQARGISLWDNLQTYGAHTNECAMEPTQPLCECTCGLATALVRPHN